MKVKVETMGVKDKAGLPELAAVSGGRRQAWLQDRGSEGWQGE
jgi:hypothetical protein